jgi:branched-chain amino acid transport system permease protein
MLFQLIIGGTASGILYSLIAMGFSLLWQTSQTINFAQGDFVAASAFIMLIFYSLLHLPYFFSLILALIVTVFILGYIFKKAIIQRILEKGLMSIICATIVVSLFIQNSIIFFYSPESQIFPSLIKEGTISILNANLSYLDLFNIVFAIFIIILLQLFLQKTKIGKALKAVAQNRETANILGIDVPKMIMLAFIINAVLSVFAAILISPIYAAKYNMGSALGLRAFYAAIIGGFNQMRGALLGGLLIGIIEVLTTGYITAEYSEAVILLIVIAVILLKPEGIWGTKEIWSKEL